MIDLLLALILWDLGQIKKNTAPPPPPEPKPRTLPRRPQPKPPVYVNCRPPGCPPEGYTLTGQF